MSSVRVVGRSVLALLCALGVFSAQATSQSPEQNPAGPGQYEPTAPPPDTTDWTNDVPAHIAVVDGTATLERDGRAEKAEENTLLLAGDRLRTERGRVEVLFPDGSALDLDHDTRVDMLSDSLVRLLNGRMRLTIARSASPTASIDYRVDASPGTVSIKTAGDYRIALSDTPSGEVELDVTVLRGSAELRNTHGLTVVRAGTHAAVTASTAPSLPLMANSAAWDEFDRWVEDQRDARYGVASATYLPDELRSYSGAFDHYGSWDHVPAYGQVWYPNVAFGWKPYHHGYWNFAASFGWHWVGYDRHWGWPTHHYGRWGYTANRWYWIPGHKWSPGWVSWGYAPSFITWSPLGYYNRPIVGFTNTYVIYPAYVWTVVPKHAFTNRVYVSHYAVPPQSIPPNTWSRFVVRPAAPVAPNTLVTRARPLRAPTRAYAVPRSSPGPAFDSYPGVSPLVATSRARPAEAPGVGTRPSPAPAGQLRSAQGAVPRAASPAAESPAASRNAVELPRNYSPEPRSVAAVPRNYSPAVRNYGAETRTYSPEPRNASPERSTTADRSSRSRLPAGVRSAPQPNAPEPDRARPAGQPWTPRSFSPEVGGHVEQGLSRVPRPYSPEPGPAGTPSVSPGGFLRSRAPDAPIQAPPSRSYGVPRGEPRAAPPTQDAPPRAAPSRTAPPDAGRGPSSGGGQAQPSRTGRGGA